ncbi:MAG: helix-turn-helix transcriptional regulator [Flavobacterium sp.]|nr:helix-turn-helix transcriptional regulator [Pedobacter sp.]
MKPQLIINSIESTSSVSVRNDVVPVINNNWHYHREVELIHFKKGNGVQFIGNRMMPFESGDIILVGANLSHYWRFDKSYFDPESRENPNVNVVHFEEGFTGDTFLNLPENKSLKALLEKSRRGIKVLGANKAQIEELIENTSVAEGAYRILNLIKTLIEISKSDNLETLSSIAFAMDLDDSDKDHIKDIYNYSFANFRNKIELEEIAEVAKISPHSFCRYFKAGTKKTYSQFLTEIKVGQACKLLIDNGLNIKQVCYESEFKNFASFHKCFKNIMGKSPLLYQKDFAHI